MELLPLLLATPLLLWCAWTDFRFMRIRNSAVLVAVAIFVLTVPAVGWGEAGLRLVAAGLVFAVGFALFAARLMGGGDVKMGSALVLFVPTGTYTLFALLFSLAMMLGIGAMLALRAIPALRRAGPVSLRAQGTFPMGIAFGLCGLMHLGALALLS